MLHTYPGLQDLDGINKQLNNPKFMEKASQVGEY
jgi:hypothetical protein